MKNLYITITALLLSVTLFAQAPQKMSYQAVVRNANDVLLSNQLLGMQVSILQGSISGTSVYTETHTPTSNTNGLVTLEIGTGTVSIGDFSTIDWGSGPYFLKTQYDLTGSSNYTITGTSQLMSVPYALHASVADSIVDGGCGHYVGEFFGGGIVYAVWDKGCHGLILGLDNISPNNGISWSNSPLITGANDLYDGAANTATIVNALGTTSPYAAHLCVDYNAGGFTDWYLPSILELRQINAVLAIIEKLLANDGNPASNPMSNSPAGSPLYFWSSTEIPGGNNVRLYYPGSTDGVGDIQTASYKVRPIRAF